MNLLDAFQYWIDDAKAQGLSESTIRTYGAAIRSFSLWLEQHDNSTIVEGIESNLVRVWVRELMASSKLSNATVTTYIAALKSVWKVLCEEGLVESNIIESVKSPKLSQKTVEAFSLQQIQQMLDSVPNTRIGLHKKFIITFLLDTGVRISELVGIDLDDLDLENCWVRVNGKGSKQRMVPFSEKLAAGTKEYVEYVRYPSAQGNCQ
jgi:site-specific recombinase XerD